MGKYLKYLILSGIGGMMYIGLELVWRGHSHWTMFFLGGICFLAIGELNELTPWCVPLWQQVFIGAALITGLEFQTGYIVNLCFGWGVWDYSGLPGNIMGQICPQYIILWVPVALVAIVLDDWLRYWMFQEERPHYCLWRHHNVY